MYGTCIIMHQIQQLSFQLELSLVDTTHRCTVPWISALSLSFDSLSYLKFHFTSNTWHNFIIMCFVSLYFIYYYYFNPLPRCYQLNLSCVPIQNYLQIQFFNFQGQSVYILKSLNDNRQHNYPQQKVWLQHKKVFVHSKELVHSVCLLFF